MKTPWYVFPLSREVASIFSTGGGIVVSHMPTELAAHIVKCVNNHDALVDALQAMVNEGWLSHGPEGMDEAQKKVYTALKQVRSEK